MKILCFNVIGIRSFENTGTISLDTRLNIFVGKNNTGKTTLLNALLMLQNPSLDGHDIRPKSDNSAISITLRGLKHGTNFINFGVSDPTIDLEMHYTWRGSFGYGANGRNIHQVSGAIFSPARPNHQIVPFLSRRKASGYDYQINSSVQSAVTGNLQHLSARVDLLATSGHFDHEAFKAAVKDIVGIQITTTGHPQGKQAGFYFDRDTFIPIERMGEGISEMVGLIVELCTERDKVFIIEEPEANLHPEALKSLLSLVRTASEHNQIIIATHSNVIVRELGSIGKIFRVYNESTDSLGPSKVQEIGSDPVSRAEILKELGYTFADFNLYEGWLFLEESSAELIIRDVLIPEFVPTLKGRLRTFSSAGVTKMERSIEDFMRLITFTHLEPLYNDKMWIMLDGDDAGLETSARLKMKFRSINDNKIFCLSKGQFEKYYPSEFEERAKAALDISDKQNRNSAKRDLLLDVVKWTNEDTVRAKVAWAESAAEPIERLKSIAASLSDKRA